MNLHYQDFRERLYNHPDTIEYKQEFYSARANQWKYADYNSDGILDLLIGVSDWREYGFFNYLIREKNSIIIP